MASKTRRSITNSRKLVFISYAHEDNKQAACLKEWLKEHLPDTVEVFDSEGSIPLGSDWLDEIRKSLKDASIAICLISPHSIERLWVYFEAGATYINDIPVVPVCIGGIERKDLRSALSHKQALEIPNEKGEKDLVELVVKQVKAPKIQRGLINRLRLPKFQYSISSSDWQFSEENIAAFERSIKDGSEIWIISANLDHDAFKGALAEAVAYNVKRGISYIYVVPQKDEIYPRVDSIRNLYDSTHLPPKFRFVERDRFDNITETNITIYNPVASKEAISEVFIELPIDREASKRRWARVDKHFSDRIIGRIRNLRDIGSDSSIGEGSES